MKIKDGYKLTEIGVIPEDWEVVNLNNLIDEKRYIKYGVVQPGVYENNGCLMLRSQDYSKGWVSDSSNMHRVNKSLEKQYQNAKIKEGDLVMTIVGAGVSKIAEIPKWLDGAVLSRSTARIALKEDVSSKFILFYLDSEFGKNQILDNVKEGAQPVVSSSDISQTKIPLPPLPEQKAIAEVLSDMDNLITGLERQIEKKRLVKQGAMQRLLTAGEDWEVVELGDAVEFLDNFRKPIKSSERSFMQGIYPYYGASGIIDYVNNYLFDDELILLGEDGENILSRNSPLAFKVKGKIWVNNHAHVLKPNEDFHIDFLTPYLESLDYKLLNTGTAQPKLNKQVCSKIQVLKPPLSEQTRIATILSDMDKSIEGLVAQSEKYRAMKVGLMQELLSGRKRLVC